MKQPEMKPLDSEAATEYGYDAGKQYLFLTYTSGGTFRYAGVSQQRVTAMLNAPSIGAYINQKIKGKFKEKQIS